MLLIVCLPVAAQGLYELIMPSLEQVYSLLQCIRTKFLMNILKSIQGLANKTYEMCVESEGHHGVIKCKKSKFEESDH